MLEFSCGLRHISLECPAPLFEDVTEEKNFVEGMLEKKKGGECKKHMCDALLQTIVCPWGCNESVLSFGGIEACQMFKVCTRSDVSLSSCKLRTPGLKHGHRVGGNDEDIEFKFRRYQQFASSCCENYKSYLLACCGEIKLKVI